MKKWRGREGERMGGKEERREGGGEVTQDNIFQEHSREREASNITPVTVNVTYE